MFAIWRVYNPNLKKESKYIKTVLTEDEAKEHCSSPDNRGAGKYFDSYTKEE